MQHNDTNGAPNWTPIVSLIGENKTGCFMYMGKGPNSLHCYKNINTRRYLNIDEAGQTFKYLGMAGTYVPVPKDEAIQHAFS